MLTIDRLSAHERVWPAVTRDVSGSGAFFVTLRQVPVGTDLQAALVVRSRSENANALPPATASLRGTVVRCEEQGFGVQFYNGFHIVPAPDEGGSLRPGVRGKVARGG